VCPVDSHTLVMNRALALGARGSGGHPSTFCDYGHRILAIGANVRVGERGVTPDIVLLNEQAGHLLALDCKGGANVDPDQDARHARMALGDLVAATRPPCVARAHTVAYAINEAGEGRIREHTDLALVVFGRDHMRAVGHLGHDGLTRRVLDGVQVRKAATLDLGVCPFSTRDDHRDIDEQVATGVSAYLAARSEMAGGHLVNLDVARDVLGVVHPLHASFSESHGQEMAKATKQSLARLERDGTLDIIRGRLMRSASGGGRDPGTGHRRTGQENGR